jgi:hypothetical protein
MKRIVLLICSAALLQAGCNNSGEKSSPDTLSADKKEKMTDAKPEAPQAPPDSAAMMKAWMEFATPGAMHKWLEKTNGTWEGEVSNWISRDAPPAKARAVNVQSSAMGGRYVIGKFSSTMMGAPMEGMSTLGYDNGKKMYVATWVDNLGTGVVHMSGTYYEATKTLNLKGHQTDPYTGKDSDIREEMKMIDDNTYTLTMYAPWLDGKEMKFMEGTFKKKK